MMGMGAMPDAYTPLVSFIVPTLNRGRHVLRAVASCLAVDTEVVRARIEVVVIDSQSEDGSWEALQHDYGDDPRVRLVQNQRGLGPTRSWLDAAHLIRGEFVTFVWSDDYISARFLMALLPMLQEETALAIGQSIVRDIDCQEELPFALGHRLVASEAFALGYFAGMAKDDIQRPVSPTCALFSRVSFDRWIETVEHWCRATPLREEVMWRRAIGPDLLLYLIAARTTPQIPIVCDCVAQLSDHPGSITISSLPWLLRVGYWLARLWLFESMQEMTTFSRATLAKMAASALVQGLFLAARAPATIPSLGGRFAAMRAMLRELGQLMRVSSDRRLFSVRFPYYCIDSAVRALVSRLT